MPLQILTENPKWDFPIYKVLANNDTGQASGNQGGMAIPKVLTEFFPTLTGTTSSEKPTIDYLITAELFDRNKFLTVTKTRYQIQTWGGTRTPEYRLTSNLGPLRNMAAGDDILVIQRAIDDLHYFRLTLVPKDSEEYWEIFPFIPIKKKQEKEELVRWGILLPNQVPLSSSELDGALREQEIHSTGEFHLFDDRADLIEAKSKKVARSTAFRSTIVRIYRKTCAFCRSSLRTEEGLLELDAAHIVPRSLMGSDDARNGLALCKRHHWAFDKGLVSVDENRSIVISDSAKRLPENHALLSLEGKTMLESDEPNLIARPEAFEWHRENLFSAD